MNVFGISHRGRVRRENQDTFRYAVVEGTKLVTAVLCDGMGGAKAGEVASAIAADSFLAHATFALDAASSAADMRCILRDAVDCANTAVYDHAFEDLDCLGMGTTLVAVLMSGNRALVGNVGDSRAYLCSGGRIVQLTTDHSLVEGLIARGRITRAEGRTHPRKNIITRAVGLDASVRCDLTELRFPEDGRLLLCSDGLSNIVTEDDMLRLLREYPEPEPACRALLDLALERGAPDNVTVLIVQN